MRFLVLAIATLTVAMAACMGGDDGPSEDEAAISQAVVAVADAQNADDVEAFLALVTDNYIIDTFSPPPARDELRQQDLTASGEPPTEFTDLDNFTVSDEAATVEAWQRMAKGASRVEISLIKEGDAWLLDGWKTLKIDTPDGATEVDVETVDNLYRFPSDENTFPAGDLALQVANKGAQEHNLFVVMLPEGVSVEEAYDVADPADVGAEYSGLFGSVQPRSATTWLLEGLEPGRYGYFCWVWDSRQGAIHANLGMAGEFTVE